MRENEAARGEGVGTKERGLRRAGMLEAWERKAAKEGTATWEREEFCFLAAVGCCWCCCGGCPSWGEGGGCWGDGEEDDGGPP